MIVQVAYLVVVDNGRVWRLLVLVHEGIVDVCVGRELHHSGLDRERKERRVEGERYSGRAHAQTVSLDSNRYVTDPTCMW